MTISFPKVEATLRRYQQVIAEECRLRNELYSGYHELDYIRNAVLERDGKAYWQVYYSRTLERMGALIEFIDERQERGERTMILDAGCGCGSEALMFAMFGASVIGIDLTERALLASARVNWWRTQVDMPLDLTFLYRDIFQVMEKHTFDGIWMQEAIQHIHPAEEFLKAALQCMNPGGRLVISDGNRLNPLVTIPLLSYYWRHSGKLKWFVHTWFSDPVTGKPVKMASERVFSRSALRHLLNEAGFETVRVESTGILPLRKVAEIFDRYAGPDACACIGWAIKMDQFCKQIPIICQLGTTLSAVATRAV